MTYLSTIQPVVDASSYVSINQKGIQRFVESFEPEKIAHWLDIMPFDITTLSEEMQLEFLFVLNSISFSYWGGPKWRVEYVGKEYDGAQAMVACLGRAIKEGIRFTPDYLCNLKRKQLAYILRGNRQIPLFEERLAILRELGCTIKNRFGGAFSNVLKEAHYDSSILAQLLSEHITSFKDCATYPLNTPQEDQQHTVIFNKRAQLLAADIAHHFDLKNHHHLTACADYKLPQVLRRYGILNYSKELQGKILRQELLRPQSPEEIEIRAHTIWAVELIRQKLNHLSANQINDYLWLQGQKKLPDDEPYHRTRTTKY